MGGRGDGPEVTKKQHWVEVSQLLLYETVAKPWITKGLRKYIKVKNKLLSIGDHGSG